MATAAPPISVDEYFAVSSEGDWTQLIDGEIVVNEPTARHQLVQGLLLRALAEWTESERGHGFASLPINVVLGDRNVYGPDLVWYADPSRIDLDSSRYPVPDLVAEIRSADTWRYDVGTKKSRYEQHGLPELWLIHPKAHAIAVHRRSRPGNAGFDVHLALAEGDVLTSTQLPGFALPLARLFSS